MLIQTIKSLFERDLKKLQTEIELYQNEDIIWHIEKNVSNSAGNLCLHIVGNLKSFIGAQLGKSNYIRNRELEFSSRDIPRVELLKQIDETKEIVSKTLDSLNDEDLKMEYPLVVFNETTTTEYFLVHLTTHLSYHLGQINYHRRLLDSH